ncbi:Ger(x)C family spore germination protein [Evansella sp. AB-rgal1]|uniref:Ger(x)C family spore germination protein n=1 Tax=Evansella sp. AB-rgal1 TaxID=3242696 RepID=UPI00359ED8BA
MKKSIFFLLRFSFFFLLVGCAEFDQPSIENYGMVGVMGFDISEDEKLKITVALPQAEKNTEKISQIITVDVDSPHRSIMEASTESEKLLSTAQLRVILFSEEFAREVGVWEVLDNLYRDPRVGTNSFIAIVKGSVEEMVKKEYPDKPDINRYLNQLLQPRTITAFSPFTTIHHFIRHVTSQVSDAICPYLENVDGAIKLTKVAIFEGSKMVSTIEREDAKIVESIKRNRKTADISYTLPGDDGEEEETIVLNFIRSKRNIKTNGDPNNPEVFIYFYITGSVVDYTGNKNISKQEERDEIEKKLSKEIEDSLLRSLYHFQELGVDPMGIGDYFRLKVQTKDWTKEYWTDILKRTTFTVHVEPRITSTGTLR